MRGDAFDFLGVTHPTCTFRVWIVFLRGLDWPADDETNVRSEHLSPHGSFVFFGGRGTTRDCQVIHGESFVVSAGPNDSVRWLQQEASALFSKEHNFHTHVVQVMLASNGGGLCYLAFCRFGHFAFRFVLGSVLSQSCVASCLYCRASFFFFRRLLGYKPRCACHRCSSLCYVRRSGCRTACCSESSLSCPYTLKITDTYSSATAKSPPYTVPPFLPTLKKNRLWFSTP